jgi:hypothetical protein
VTAERGTNTKSTLLGLCESAVSAMRTHAGPVALLLLLANVARSEIGVNREISCERHCFERLDLAKTLAVPSFTP